MVQSTNLGLCSQLYDSLGLIKFNMLSQDNFHYILTAGKNGFIFLLSATTGKTETD